MKIHQLANGARFEYEGEEYVKSGPLFAIGRTGQRLIPKYAVLKPLDAAAVATAAAQRDSLPRDEVLAAFERFCAACRPLLADDRQAALEAARADFLKTLD